MDDRENMNGWVIEAKDKRIANGVVPDSCLCIADVGSAGSQRKTWYFGSADHAVRFCRKEDAEAVAGALCRDIETVAVEHVWH